MLKDLQTLLCGKEITTARAILGSLWTAGSENITENVTESVFSAKGIGSITLTAENGIVRSVTAA